MMPPANGSPTLSRIHVDARTMLGAATLAFLILSGGCDDDPAQNAEPPRTAASPVKEHSVAWLESNSRLAPERWLASRGENDLRSPSDPEVLRIKRILDEAHRLYRESPRMIANRAVQVEQMLKAQHIEESATSILEDLSSVAGEAGQTEGFGSLSQHYANLRLSGTVRAEALSILRNRYGRRP